MKKLLLALFAVIGLSTAVNAADMAVKARPLSPPAPIFSWTGFYIGAHAGGGWFDKSWTAPLTPINITGCPGCPLFVGSHTASSWLAGGQVGFNYQTGMWVLGIEADGSWTDLNATSANGLVPAFLFIRSKTDAVGTFAGRVGIAANQALFYVKGGGAVASDRFATGAFGPPLVEVQAASDTRWGWMVGVGIEYAFTPNWSVKAEYNYLDFGTFRETVQPTGALIASPFQYDIRQRMDLVKIGLNYRFGWTGPVVAKY
jgi:outer membrane immunogenic protein